MILDEKINNNIQNSKMNLLVFEFFTASGINDLTIISEAKAMINSLLNDLKGLDENKFNIYHLFSEKFDLVFNKNTNIHKIIINADLKEWLDKNITKFDGVIFIAGEDNMNLYNLTRIIEEKDVKIFGSDSTAVLTCSDKFKTYKHLKNIIKQPKTFKIEINSENNWKIAIKNIFKEKQGNILISKPVSGVDSQDIVLIETVHDIDRLSKIYSNGSEILIQNYIKGDSVSVSLISVYDNGIKKVFPISLNKQFININSHNQKYMGGEIPYNHPFKEKAFEIAKKAVESIDGIYGFVGVDLIFTEDEIYFLEINSRFTTPYVGLQKLGSLKSFNIVKIIVESLLNNNFNFNSIDLEELIEKKIVFKKKYYELEINLKNI
jgi:predicted ATP-grasp superfamily ATP-dependent carboligase